MACRITKTVEVDHRGRVAVTATARDGATESPGLPKFALGRAVGINATTHEPRRDMMGGTIRIRAP